MIKIGQTLYKLDNKGKIREWEIFVGTENGAHFYSVSHGVMDGAKQFTKVIVKDGKNIGRKNATTAQEQCLAEAESLHLKQMERKGYTSNIPEEKPYLPMLAQDFNKHSAKISYPAVVSPKIDGARLIIKVQNGKVTTSSRTGKPFYGLDHITNQFAALNDCVVDGELYSDKLSFQEIMSVVRKSKSIDPRVLDVYFFAFDLINDNTYHTRVLQLEHLCMNMSYVKIVPWYIVDSVDKVKYYHQKFTQEGYEGSMIRNLQSHYAMNQRSYNLQKYKDFFENEYIIVGYKSGVGKFSNVPTFTLTDQDGKLFEAVPRGTESDRAHYLQNADQYIKEKRSATVRYFELTDDGIPRFPVITKIAREVYGDV